jgi:Skp family chaperone for outer membrane proteins
MKSNFLALRPTALFTSVLLTLVRLTAAEPPAPAPVPAQLRIAVVDTEGVLLGSALGRAAMADLRANQEAQSAAIRAKHEEIKKLQAELEAKKLSLSPEQSTALSDRIANLQVEAKRAAQAAEQALGEARDQMLAQLDGKLMPVINEVARREKFTAVFRKFESGLIFVEDEIDITHLVIARLDELHPAKPAPARTP